MGEISREELDLLTIVASARLGDTEQARFVLKRFGSLSTTQQQDWKSARVAAQRQAAGKGPTDKPCGR
jgi:hypothetical protein